MADKEKDQNISEEIEEPDYLDESEDDESIVVEMVDEDGNKTYYEEEMIIPIGEEQFALLIGIEMPDDDEHEHHHHDHEHDHEHHHHHHDHDHDHDHEHHHHHHDDEEDDETEVLIAKIKVNEDGNEEYVEPTDEEFEAVLARYEEIMGEDEDS